LNEVYIHIKDLFSALNQRIRSLGTQGVLSLSDQLVASITNFLTGVIIGRACTKEGFGLYLLCFNILLVVLDLQSSVLASPYTIFSHRLRGRRLAAYTGNTLVQELMLCLFVVFSLKLSGLYMPGLFVSSPDIGSVLDALSISISFIMVKEFIRRLCFARLLMKTALLVDMAVAGLQLGGLSILWLMGLISPSATFWIMGLSCALTTAGWLFINRGSYTFDHKEFFSDFARNWSFGGWVLASGVLWSLSMTAYPWILAYFHGAGAAGIWAACWGVVSLSNPLMLGVQNYLGPKIVKLHAENGILYLRDRVLRYSLLYLLLILPIVLILLIAGGDLLVLFYGEKYGGNGGIVRILAINLMLMAAAFPATYGLLATERVRLYFMANLVPLIITLSCGIFLVKNFGAFGVALGLLLGIFLTAFVIGICFLKSIKVAMVNGRVEG